MPLATSYRPRHTVRLVSIFDSPAPYTTPVLNALDAEVELHVIYLSAKDQVSGFDDSFGVHPSFDYSVHWARRLDMPSTDFQVELSLGVTRAVSQLKPDVVLLVSWKPAVLEPLFWTRWSGSAVVMWAESTRSSGLLRGSVSTRLRRLLTYTVDGYVTNGTEAAHYLRDLGVQSDRIVTSCLPAGCVSRSTHRHPRLSADEIRFLFVGRLISRKRPLEVIGSFADVHSAVPNATLTVVGAGELETAVRQAASQTPGVEYVGRFEGEELAAIYAECDVLVLPALREVWGVVVNEAMSHGLFVVASDQVGSAHDLVGPGTGRIVPAEDVDSLAAVMVDVARTVDTSDGARARRAQTVAHCTPERFAADIVRAADIATRVRRTRRRRPRRHASSP